MFDEDGLITNRFLFEEVMQEEQVVEAMVDFYDKEIAFDIQGYMQSQDGQV